MFEADINCRADLVKWLEEVRDAIDGPDATLIHRDRWFEVDRRMIGYARALRLRDKLKPFGEPMQYPTIDYAELETDIRDELRARIENLHAILTGTAVTTDAEKIWYQDIADIVGVERKTVFNRASGWKKQCDAVDDGCSYSVIHPFLATSWPTEFSGVDFATMRKILNLRRAEPGVSTSGS